MIDFQTSFPELGKFFATGSLVQSSVLELEGSKPGQKKIKLSLNPKDVNSSLSKSSLKQGMVCTCTCIFKNISIKCLKKWACDDWSDYIHEL